MLQALGVSFKDVDDKEIAQGGAALSSIHRIDISQMNPLLHDVEFKVACDVTNPLLGENGATKYMDLKRRNRKDDTKVGFRT